MPKILFFSPHAAIWPYSKLEDLVGDSLRRGGFTVKHIRCQKDLNKACLSMYAMGHPPLSISPSQKEKVCHICLTQKSILKTYLNQDTLELSAYVDDGMEIFIQEHLQKVDRNRPGELIVDTIPIGRIAFYEYFLHLKRLDVNLSDREWEVYLSHVYECLKVFYLTRKILIAEKPSYVSAFNNQYSTHAVFAHLARSLNIETFFINAGDCLSKFHQTAMIGLHSTAVHQQHLLQSLWPRYKDLPSAPSLDLIKDHFKVLMESKISMTFSSGIAANKTLDLYEYFGIRRTQKIIVATLSSLDERFAEELVGITPRFSDLLFKDQIEWVQFLIKYVKEKNDLFLLIRVHPREFPNKRDSSVSEHARILKETFLYLPTNARVNWPSDNISIFTLATEADLFLNAWSTAGKEMTLLGVPVLSYAEELPLYPTSIHYLGKTKTEYLSQMELALKNGWSLDHTRNAARWFSLDYIDNLFDLSDGIRVTEQNYRTGIFSFALRILEKANPTWVRKLEMIIRSRSLQEDNNILELFKTKANSRAEVIKAKHAATKQEETKIILDLLSSIAQILFRHSGKESKLAKAYRSAGVSV